MKRQTLLMAFEELWPILLKISPASPIWRQIRIPAGYFSVLEGVYDEDVLTEWAQKHQRTWWEVTWAFPDYPSEPILQQCRYVADSFSDAVRLKPQLVISYHSLETLTAPDMELFEDLEFGYSERMKRTPELSAAKTEARA
ncbi:MAG TPA: hypothetical protein PK054_05095 [Anaerohalosphaeraceae bacterium]|nr:hypothetical protein [Anaerohalosphaeraceae bacterium]HOL88756.1 hypothetical protein [Anaerohalosphaeraceae bacterium]HPP55941.1 hypothetical protein [Anaerohalosphaeraceae bacterium]